MYKFITDNPTMVDAYWNIFNSMVSLFSNEIYISLLKLSFMLGGFFIFFYSVLQSFQGSEVSKSPKDFLKYMLIGTTLLSILFSVKADLLVTTNNLPSYCPSGSIHKSKMIDGSITTSVVVGNVPQVLAWSFSFLNEIGIQSTNLAKQAFNSVTGNFMVTSTRSDYANFLQGVNGIMSSSLNSFGGDTQYGGSNANLGELYTHIMNDCVYIPAMQDEIGDKVVTVLKTTGNTFETLNDLIINSTLVSYKNPTNNSLELIEAVVKFNGTEPKNLLMNIGGATYTCEYAWGEFKNKFIDLKNSGAVECHGSLRDTLGPLTLTALTGETNSTLAMGRDIAMNAALTNQLLDSQKNLANGEISYASGKSMSEMAYKSVGTGHFIAEMLPYLQMGIRAVLYAFFPFVFIIILMPGGIKVLLSYMQTLIWIELWTPIAAILNMFLSLSSTQKFTTMYQSHGLNVLNGAQTFSDAYMLAGVAGYLYASVPAIAYLILKESGELIAGIGEGLAGVMGKNLDTKTMNEDYSARRSNSLINEQRREQKLSTISLAEQDYKSANHNAQLSSGKFMANEGKLGELSTSSEASTKKSIADGSNEARLRLMYGDKGVDNTRALAAVTDHATKAKTQEALGINNYNKADDMGIINAGKNVKDYSAMERLLTGGKNLSSKEIYDNAIKMGETIGNKKLLDNSKQGIFNDMSGANTKNGLENIASVQSLDQVSDFQSKENLQKSIGSDYVSKVSDIKGTKEAYDTMVDASNILLQNSEKSWNAGESRGLNQSIEVVANQKFQESFNADIEKISSIKSTNEFIETKSESEIQKISSNSDRINSGVVQKIASIGKGLNVENKQNLALSSIGREDLKNSSINEKARIINSVGVEGLTYKSLVSDLTYKGNFEAGLSSSIVSSKNASEVLGEKLKLNKMRDLILDDKISSFKSQELASKIFPKLKDFSGENKNILFSSIALPYLKSTTEVYSNLEGNSRSQNMFNKMNSDQAGKMAGSSEYQEKTEQSYRQGKEDEWAKVDFLTNVLHKMSALGDLFTTIATNTMAFGGDLSKERNELLKAKDKNLDEINRLKNKQNQTKSDKSKLFKLEKEIIKTDRALSKNYKASQKTMVGSIKMAADLMGNKVGKQIANQLSKAQNKIKKEVVKKIGQEGLELASKRASQAIKVAETTVNLNNAANYFNTFGERLNQYQEEHSRLNKLENTAAFISKEVVEAGSLGLVNENLIQVFSTQLGGAMSGSISYKEATENFFHEVTTNARLLYLQSEGIHSIEKADELNLNMQLDLKRLSKSVDSNMIGNIGELTSSNGQIFKIERSGINDYQYVFEKNGTTLKINSNLRDNDFSEKGKIDNLIRDNEYDKLVLSIELSHISKNIDSAFNSNNGYAELKSRLNGLDQAFDLIGRGNKGLNTLAYDSAKDFFF